MVLSGLSTVWRLANWPTRRSPVLVNATTEGVKRLPSLLMITVGFPPSITATTEFVVPRSMPTAFAIPHLTLCIIRLAHSVTRPLAPDRAVTGCHGPVWGRLSHGDLGGDGRLKNVPGLRHLVHRAIRPKRSVHPSPPPQKTPR